MKLLLFLLITHAGFAFSSDSLNLDIPQCYVGSENQIYYTDSFSRALKANNSPLIQEFNYKKERTKLFQKLSKSKLTPFLQAENYVLPIGLSNLVKFAEASNFNNQKNWISRDQVKCALLKVPFVDTQKALCDSSNSTPHYTRETPCVNDEMVEYIHFVTNKAFKCFGRKMDNYTKEVILKKINLESAFGFFFADTNGKGISQIVSITAFEMSAEKQSGHEFLMDYLKNNPAECQAFTSILKNNTNESRDKMNTCGYVNIKDGIGRSLIQGMGLYFYYRDNGDLSARSLLSWLGVAPSANAKYQEMLKILTLGMYNKGPAPVLDSIKLFFEKNELKNFSKEPNVAFNKFIEKIESTNFYMYAKEADRQYNKVFAQNGSCKLTKTTLVTAK